MDVSLPRAAPCWGRRVTSVRLAPQTGTAFLLSAGDILRVTDDRFE